MGAVIILLTRDWGSTELEEVVSIIVGLLQTIHS